MKVVVRHFLEDCFESSKKGKQKSHTESELGNTQPTLCHSLVSLHFMCGREVSTLVVILSVCLSSREFTFRSSNLNIVCSTATSFSPLMEKVSFYCTFVFREPRKV